MIARSDSRYDATWPAAAVFGAIGASSACLAYGALRFPESFVAGGGAAFAMVLASLIAYAVVANCLRRASSLDWKLAFHLGGIAGASAAAVAMANHSLELWTTLPPPVGAVLGGGMWAVMFLSFGLSCSMTVSRGGSLAAGVLASVWCAMVMAATLVGFALSMGFLSMNHMQYVLAEPFATSGMTDASAFVTRHLVSAASSHLYIAPALAAAVGLLSACAYVSLSRVSNRVARWLAALAIAVLAAGGASLWHASSLRRGERPPFVDFGLVSLAVTLVSIHPLIAAARARER